MAGAIISKFLPVPTQWSAIVPLESSARISLKECLKLTNTGRTFGTSAVMVTLFEFLSPVADAIGLQLDFIATVSKAISQATAIPFREAEILFLLALAAMLLEIGRIVWDLITS
jgi:hypothetical protein